MCCALPSVAEYKQRFVSPHANYNDPGALPTARIVLSKGKLVLDLYLDLQKRKAYGTALLANDQSACESINISDLHDEEEIAHLLQEAEREVLDEEEVEQEMLATRGEWGDAIEDRSLPSPYRRTMRIPTPFVNIPITRDRTLHPPIGVEAAILNTITKQGREKADDMGWGPSASMTIDAYFQLRICQHAALECLDACFTQYKQIGQHSIYPRTMVQPHLHCQE
jgi:hypothetical protein